ncbi:tRNA (5-methylaminomethyl-2-thiouridine)(34)-methyltransferase MnmD [Rhodopirellula sp. MGV]|uniref:tRNA (5-methylaminomethyl-2-thiouridine)(34)-methyltransferase MnmD n=1 Tax=Rhodopirellula sp. MGV TaxID=2023130 RepID=UPI0013046BA2|nr:tRNA (5-methylaminomethyl-2-thiouridine)(34)-methyltransferase MnmD [Rhodopirellula sp. MGV]
MPIPQRATFPTDRPDLNVLVTDDGSRTLLRTGTSDSFHSGCGALSETRHVYLHNSGVAERLAHQRPTRVLEIGLGTAMGMIVTIGEAIHCDSEIDYVALETDWIAATTMQHLNPHEWTQESDLVDRYLDFRRSISTPVQPGRYQWAFDRLRRLRVDVADAAKWRPGEEAAFDAIYYDPFCPESAPQLWSSDCFRQMKSAITATGTLTTYSCSRAVRDALAEAGWSVDRVAGPVGGKREVLIARPQ